MIDHDEIVKRCLELDEMNKKERLLVYYLNANKHTFRLDYSIIIWGMLAENERYCMVKYGNYFLTEEAAVAARDRIFENHLQHS